MKFSQWIFNAVFLEKAGPNIFSIQLYQYLAYTQKHTDFLKNWVNRILPQTPGLSQRIAKESFSSTRNTDNYEKNEFTSF